MELTKIEKEQESNLLGIQWNAQEDTLCFIPPTNSKHSRITKRKILSEIASLFDPLGGRTSYNISKNFNANPMDLKNRVGRRGSCKCTTKFLIVSQISIIYIRKTKNSQISD